MSQQGQDKGAKKEITTLSSPSPLGFRSCMVGYEPSGWTLGFIDLK
jgi:hypothetical protein